MSPGYGSDGQRGKIVLSSRNPTLKTGGALTAKEALFLQEQKVEKEVAKQAKKAARALKSQAV
jgi:hypothetical protein